MDIKQRLAELRAKKELETKAAITNNQAAEIAGDKAVANAIAKSQENNNAQDQKIKVSENTQSLPVNISSTEVSKEVSSGVSESISGNVNTVIGTARTSEIDHLAFMSNLQELADAIIHQHPRMPVLLMAIHKHLRTDPELVTTLSEEEIGVIVNGLKIQTKTELTGTVLKQSKAKAKKTVLSTDMF